MELVLQQKSDFRLCDSQIHSFMPAVFKYLLSFHSRPGTVVGIIDIAVNKKDLYIHEAYIFGGKRWNINN